MQSKFVSKFTLYFGEHNRTCTVPLYKSGFEYTTNKWKNKRVNCSFANVVFV